MVKLLLRQGVSRSKAVQLQREQSAIAIKSYVDNIDLIIKDWEGKSGQTVANRAGFLVSAIEKGVIIPDDEPIYDEVYQEVSLPELPIIHQVSEGAKYYQELIHLMTGGMGNGGFWQGCVFSHHAGNTIFVKCLTVDAETVQARFGHSANRYAGMLKEGMTVEFVDKGR